MRTPLFVYRLRKRLRRLDFALSALLLALAFAAGAGFMLLTKGEATRSEQEAAAAPVPTADPQNAEPAPSGGKLAARMEAAAIEEMRQQPHADLSSLPVLELPPPLLSIDGTGFWRGEETIRLDRVEGPRAGDVCLDGAQRWSCGLQARAALHNLVAGRSLFCQPRRALADGGTSADCRLEATGAFPAGDVARLLVRQGWARPAAGSEVDFAAELGQARAANAGLWRGGWLLSAP